jgi:hypothetical protein
MSYRTRRSLFLHALGKKGVVSQDHLNPREDYNGRNSIFEQKHITIYFGNSKTAQNINFYSSLTPISTTYLPLLLSTFLPDYLIAISNASTFFQSMTGRPLPSNRSVYSISFIPGSVYRDQQHIDFIDENDDQLIVHITLFDPAFGSNDPDAYYDLYYAVVTSNDSKTELRPLSQ